MQDKISEITDAAVKNDLIDSFEFDPPEMDQIDKVFQYQLGETEVIFFFQNKDGAYHTVMERDSIHTHDLGELKTWLASFDTDEN